MEQFYLTSLAHQEESLKLIQDHFDKRMEEFRKTLCSEKEELIKWMKDTPSGIYSAAFKEAKQKAVHIKNVLSHLTQVLDGAKYQHDISDIVLTGIPKWCEILSQMEDAFPKNVKSESQVQIETREIKPNTSCNEKGMNRRFSSDFIKVRKLFPASTQQACVHCHVCRDEDGKVESRSGRLSGCGNCGQYS